MKNPATWTLEFQEQLYPEDVKQLSLLTFFSINKRYFGREKSRISSPWLQTDFELIRKLTYFSREFLFWASKLFWGPLRKKLAWFVQIEFDLTQIEEIQKWNLFKSSEIQIRQTWTEVDDWKSQFSSWFYSNQFFHFWLRDKQKRNFRILSSWME